jgi:proteasome accessory factor BC
MTLEKEKLVRQLSLVAYLMSMNRAVTARDVRESVEGYARMKDDAFARRFYADRTDLMSLGVPLGSTKDLDTGEELYTLSAADWCLPALDLTDREVAALQSTLSLLDGQFAYAEPLRVALQNLTLGREDPARDAALASTTVRLVGADYSPEIAQRISKLETAITKRRTVTFNYHTMSRNDVTQRVVNPYTLVWNGGQWYLVGHSHERDAVRMFRLGRIQGEIKFTSRKERDFVVPEEFDASVYRTRPPWQLGEVQGEAELWVHPTAAWWVERSFGHAGTCEHHDDGSMTFHTEYAGSTRWLASWVLGMNGLVRPVGPEELVVDTCDSLDRIVAAHEGTPDAPPAELPRLEEADRPATRRRRQPQPPVPVETEQFAVLQALMADLLASADGKRGEGCVPVADLMERYGLDEEGVRQAVDLLTLVNFGAGAYAIYAEVDGDQVLVDAWPDGEVFRRPARLSPLEAKALMLALDLVGPLVAATAASDLDSVRAKVTEAFGGYGAPSVPATVPSADDQLVLTRTTDALRDRRVLSMEYYSQSRGELTWRQIEPLALQRLTTNWYVIAWCRRAEDVRSFRLDRIKQVEVLDEHSPEREVDLDGYLADTPAELADAPRSVHVRFAPSVARWVVENRSDASPLIDGSALLRTAASGDAWLIEEVLKYRGEAEVLEPADMRERVAERARALADELTRVPVSG